MYHLRMPMMGTAMEVSLFFFHQSYGLLSSQLNGVESNVDDTEGNIVHV